MFNRRCTVCLKKGRRAKTNGMSQDFPVSCTMRGSTEDQCTLSLPLRMGSHVLGQKSTRARDRGQRKAGAPRQYSCSTDHVSVSILRSMSQRFDIMRGSEPYVARKFATYACIWLTMLSVVLIQIILIPHNVDGMTGKHSKAFPSSLLQFRPQGMFAGGGTDKDGTRRTGSNAGHGMNGSIKPNRSIVTSVKVKQKLTRSTSHFMGCLGGKSQTSHLDVMRSASSTFERATKKRVVVGDVLVRFSLELQISCCRKIAKSDHNL